MTFLQWKTQDPLFDLIWFCQTPERLVSDVLQCVFGVWQSALLIYLSVYGNSSFLMENRSTQERVNADKAWVLNAVGVCLCSAWGSGCKCSLSISPSALFVQSSALNRVQMTFMIVFLVDFFSSVAYIFMCRDCEFVFLSFLKSRVVCYFYHLK